MLSRFNIVHYTCSMTDKETDRIAIAWTVLCTCNARQFCLALTWF